jgi:DNA ligase-1
MVRGRRAAEVEQPRDFGAGAAGAYGCDGSAEASPTTMDEEPVAVVAPPPAWAPPLATAYAEGKTDPTGWWMSEKLDGMRALWDGEGTLFSRAGNAIHAPKSASDTLPRGVPLDGELWLGRGRFQECMSVVRSHREIDEEWRDIRYLVFDSPGPEVFEARARRARDALEGSGTGFAAWHEHTACSGAQHVSAFLKDVEDAMGEGAMLRHPTAPYRGGRSSELQKVKSRMDGEAIVVGHEPGGGKNVGRLGALVCEGRPPEDATAGEGASSGGGGRRRQRTTKRFKVGTGFTEEEREHPPPIGSVVTYRYFELTKSGVPRFPSYWRQANAA